MTAGDPLERLRERIRSLDQDLLARAAERVRLAREVGSIKRGRGLPTVDFSQERDVLARGRDQARSLGIEESLAEELLAQLIRAAVSAQDEDRLRVHAAGAGKQAVVVGGAGRMGRWLERFLSAQGYSTGILDPAAGPEEVERGRAALRTADLVLCATPPEACAALYREWSHAPPAGVIADIASVKTPLIEPIRALQRAGARVGSLHPMFGPSIVLLRDADVVVCETGDGEATAAVEDLFRPTTVRLVRLPLEEHDRIMADLLSLAHATAIAFALALPPEAHPVRSTTFQALESLAGAVVRESPEVYYEIQVGNPESAAAVARLRGALDRIHEAVETRDFQAFRTLMTLGRERTAGGLDQGRP